MALVKYNNNSISSVTALDSVPSGDMVLLATNTITSGVASSSFTSNIDSTYKTYIFKFINIHPATDGVTFQFNGSVDGGSNYNVTKTTTSFFSFHYENGSDQELGYSAANDLAQSTSYKNLADSVGNDNDQSASGYLYLFDPSNTTFVKHFINDGNHSMNDNRSNNRRAAGYFNTTSAINAIDFKFASGNIDSGVIKMYGLRES